jgi:hypothetical protein
VTGGFLLCKLWRGQRDAKTNFLKMALIGKNYWLSPIKLILSLFRVGGRGAEKNLSADPEYR